jgi:RNA polymerase sigma-70 factor (ECF subfamily)
MCDPTRSGAEDCEQDAAIMRQFYAQPGNAKVLNPLVERYQARLAGYLCWLVGSREEALDLFQDTWHRVMGTRAGVGFAFDPDKLGRGSFWTWLRQIARSVASGHLRKRQRARPYLLTEEQSAILADEQVSDPGQIVELRDLVAQLPLDLRQVVILRYYDDCEIQDISHTLNIKVNTVHTRLHRARHALRRVFGGEIS